MKCIEKVCAASGSLFVDDLSVGYSSHTLNGVERRLQAILRALEKWCDENGFQFEPTKTICVHFTKKQNVVREPELFLNGLGVPVRRKPNSLVSGLTEN